MKVLLSVTGMVDLSVTIMQVTVSVAAMQLEFSAAHIQMTPLTNYENIPTSMVLLSTLSVHFLFA